jgi:L-threonylcarbamoyladenylate synthase
VTAAEQRAEQLAGGSLAVLPTDTVYGLVCVAADRAAANELYRLKGRAEIQPTALLAAGVDVLLESLPELEGRMAAAVRALLPGPFTLVVSNPGRRYSWLSAARPDVIGVRAPALPEPAAEIVERVGMVVATSANVPGGSDPRRLDDVPDEILAGVAFSVDGGALPGAPSTVIDLSGATPVVLRVGAGDPEEALARLEAILTGS